MALTTAEKIGAGVVGAVVVGAIWFGSSGTAEASTPEENGPRSRPVPPSGTSELQPDPFPTPAQIQTMSQTDRRALLRTVQFQLNALGYGPLDVDGIAGPLTGAALRRFVDDAHVQQPAGGGAAAGEAAAALALDAAYRQRFGLSPRIASSGGVYGRAARRSARLIGYGQG